MLLKYPYDNSLYASQSKSLPVSYQRQLVGKLSKWNIQSEIQPVSELQQWITKSASQPSIVQTDSQSVHQPIDLSFSQQSQSLAEFS